MSASIKIFFAVLLFAGSYAFAQSSGRFAITRSVMSGGGTTASTNSHFRLDSTVAQPLAAVPTNAHFSIQGGFWIVPAPIMFGPKTAGTNFLVSIQSEPGKTYTVQYKNSLDSSWQSLPSVVGTGGIITVTNSAVGTMNRFYRLVEK